MKFRMSFRIKLLLLTIVPLVVAQLTLMLGATRVVEQQVKYAARESLTVGSRVVDEFLTARTEQLHTSVEVVAADYGLKEAVASADSPTIRSALENHRRRVDADLAAFVDLDGGVVSTVLNGASGEGIGTRQLAAAARQQSRQSTISVGDIELQLFSVPLKAPVTAGWVVLGFGLDQQLIDQMAALTGLEVSLVRTSGERNDPSDDRGTGVDLTRDVGVVYSSDAQESLFRHTRFLDADPSLVVVLRQSVSDSMKQYLETRRRLTAFGAVLLIFAIAAAAWFSMTIVRPLRALSTAAERMRSGDYASVVEVRSDDEVGRLASSFTAMQSAIADREKHISHNALHDSLTDLPNRRNVVQRLEDLLRTARRDDTRIAVLSIELARMSEITSTLGHTATDELIKMAARYLRGNFRENEILGQSGTNEFVVILPASDIDRALAYANRIQNLLNSGVALGRANVILHSRIGIAAFPSHGRTARDLLRFAAIARTEAKNEDEACRVYRCGTEDDFVRRMRIVNDMPAAIRRGEIQLWYQPKISLPTGNVVGVEALARWHHPELGDLKPEEFISAAEQAGTIIVLSRYVVANAVRACRRLQEQGHPVNMSVNISARDLADENYLFHVREVLKEESVPAERLTIEVTESSIMADVKHSIRMLELLRDIGVRVSMDDFGTGHSSLAQLKKMPLNELKIDKSFILEAGHQINDCEFVRTIIDLAHSIDLGVVAEGAEDADTVRRLCSIGCEQVQGYFISRPVPYTELVKWLGAFEPTDWSERRGVDRAFRSGQRSA